MPDVENLKNAPIEEAIIDLRVSLPEDCDQENFRQVTEDLKDIFSEKQEQRQVTHQITDNIDGDISKIVTEKMNGFNLRTENQRHFLQVTREGFTLSELKPYSDWVSFEKIAKTAWASYAKRTAFESINRIALRYINNIELQMAPGVPFEEYLTAAPVVPDGLPQGVYDFATRVSFVDPETRLNAHISQAMQSKPDGKISVILDIDVYKNIDMPVADDDLWVFFSDLRDLKNKIFFSYITDKTKEMLR